MAMHFDWKQETAAPESLMWIVPPKNGGQIVEISYAEDDGAERLWRRILDRSDNSKQYAWVAYSALPDGFDQNYDL